MTRALLAQAYGGAETYYGIFHLFLPLLSRFFFLTQSAWNIKDPVINNNKRT